MAQCFDQRYTHIVICRPTKQICTESSGTRSTNQYTITMPPRSPMTYACTGLDALLKSKTCRRYCSGAYIPARSAGDQPQQAHDDGVHSKSAVSYHVYHRVAYGRGAFRRARLDIVVHFVGSTSPSTTRVRHVTYRLFPFAVRGG